MTLEGLETSFVGVDQDMQNMQIKEEQANLAVQKANLAQREKQPKPAKPARNRNRAANESSRQPAPDRPQQYCENHGHNFSHRTIPASRAHQSKPPPRGTAYAAQDEDNYTSDEEESVSLITPTAVSLSTHTFIVDSGASSNMTFDRSILDEYRSYRVKVRVADGRAVYSEGVGTCRLQCKSLEPFVLTRVLHVPALKCNLFSLPAFNAVGDSTISFNGPTCQMQQHGKIVLTGTLEGSLYRLDAKILCPVEEAFVALDVWHKRLGHVSMDRLRNLNKREFIPDMKGCHEVESHTCEACILGKSHRTAFPKVGSRAKSILALIHTDLHDTTYISRQGYRYWISFIDDYSRFAWVYPLHKKSDTFEVFKKWQAKVERQTGKLVKVIRDDKGGEYSSQSARQHCTKYGIGRQMTTRATPQQNGVAERLNRTIEERVTAMLQHSHLPESFWADALRTYMEGHNAITTSAIKDSTPYITFHGEVPKLGHLRAFGCLAYQHILKDQRRHLQAHSRRSIFIG